MAVNLTGIFADAANLLPSSNDLLQQIIAGAAGTVVLSGLQTAQGKDAIDPLHIFHKPADNNGPAASGFVQGKVMTMGQFMALSPDNQKMIQAMGFTIIPG